MSDFYEFFYWPSIQGRGEFVRLAMEQAGVTYVDVSRVAGREGEMAAMMKAGDPLPFAPPILKHGDLVISQTANILDYLGQRHDLAPKGEAGRMWALQLQLTMADFAVEAHDTHHPIAKSLYYEEQKEAAARRSEDFRSERMPKFLGYFERVLERNAAIGGHLAGDRLTYADLSLFQIVAGLRYAFPKAMAGLEGDIPRTVSLAATVEQLPNIAAYLASDRRLPFNDHGLFRCYPELDG